MKISELVSVEEISTHLLPPDTEISGIAIKARDVKDGYLYIVTNSEKASFNLLSARPAAIICPKSTEVPRELQKITEICENSLLLASFVFARFLKIDFEKLKFIGITGTNGKSTTAVMLKKILTDSGYKVGYIGTGKIESCERVISDEYYSMTTPEPDVLYPAIKRLADDGCEVIIMEVSSHALKLSRVEPIPFEYGVFTNLSPEHSDFHTDMEDYFLAKTKLMKASKIGVFNVDDSYARRAARSFEGRKITAGVLWKGDVYARDIESYGFSGIGYVYRAKKFSFMMRLRMPGIFNVYNSMLALAVATDMGVLPCKAKNSLASLSVVDGRFEIIKGDITAIIDYAHTAVGFENILKSLNALKNAGQKLGVVFGCGGERDKRKRPLMASIAEKYADISFVTSDNPRGENPERIIADITAGFTKKNFVCEPDRSLAIRKAILSAQSGDIVAVIGKGAEKYSIDLSGYHSFDEKRIIAEALKERERQHDDNA